MYRTGLIAGVLIFSLSMTAHPEGRLEVPPDRTEAVAPVDPDELCRKFLNQMSARDLEACEVLKPHCFADELAYQINDLSAQLPAIFQGQQHMGRSRGIELVQKREFGASVLQLKYFLKFEDTFRFYQFTFLRVQDDWKIAGLGYNLSIEELIHRQSPAPILKPSDVPAAPRALCELFLARMLDQDDQALEVLAGHGCNEKVEAEFAELSSGLPAVLKVHRSFGRPLGCELVEARRYGESVLKLDFVTKFEKQFGLLSTVFLRIDDSWRIAALKFDGLADYLQ